MESFQYKEETYRLIGVCMNVQKSLGYGFSEVIYKDAIEADLAEVSIPYERESELCVMYKGKRLAHKFFADFICFGKIIVEIKSSEKGITDDHIAQTLNYLRASENSIGLIINFGKRRLDYKRLIMS